MKHYFMELKKFLKREVETVRPLNTCRVNKTLCQDLLFKLDIPFLEVGGLSFSNRFFYDFNSVTTVTDDRLFVIDGVKALHQVYGGEYELVKTRSLYLFLYTGFGDETEDYIEALADNPWLANLANGYYTRITQRAAAAKVTAAQFYKDIFQAIVAHADEKILTPRGVWGLDTIFGIRPSVRTHIPQLQIGKYFMVPLKEYQDSFK